MQLSRRGGYRINQAGLPGLVALFMFGSLIILLGIGCDRGAESAATAGTGPGQRVAADTGQSVPANAGQHIAANAEQSVTAAVGQSVTATAGESATANAAPGVMTGGDGSREAGSSQAPGKVSHVLVTYFYTTFRCPTCLKLEQYSRETVERDFAREIGEHRLAFRSINVQEPENEHYVQDYSLFTKSLVVSFNQDGKELRWKNLPDIWKYVQDRDRFEQYVREEVQAFVKDL